MDMLWRLINRIIIINVKKYMRCGWKIVLALLLTKLLRLRVHQFQFWLINS